MAFEDEVGRLVGRISQSLYLPSNSICCEPFSPFFCSQNMIACSNEL